MATAQSLADTTAMHLSMSLTLICSPSSRYTQLPPKEAALALAVTVSSRRIFPASRSSTISSMVITLVTLAGKPLLWASFSYSTSPVSFSISMAEGAVMSISPSLSGADAIAPVGSRQAMAMIKDNIRFMLASPSFLTGTYEDKTGHMPWFTQLCIIRQSKNEWMDRDEFQTAGKIKTF